MKKNKNCTMKLLETLKNREPLLVYLKVGKEISFYDKFSFNEKKNIYQGQFGYLDLDIVMEIITGNEKYNHIELEVAN